MTQRMDMENNLIPTVTYGEVSVMLLAQRSLMSETCWSFSKIVRFFFHHLLSLSFLFLWIDMFYFNVANSLLLPASVKMPLTYPWSFKDYIYIYIIKGKREHAWKVSVDEIQIAVLLETVR